MESRTENILRYITVNLDVFPELVGKEVPKKEEEPNVKSPVENSVINLDVEQSLNFSRLWYLIPGLFLYLIFVKVVSRM
jgi:hypothetical protein